MRTVASCAYSQYDQHAGEPHPQTAKQCFIVAISKQHTLLSFQAMHIVTVFLSFFGLYYPSSGAATLKVRDISGTCFPDGTQDRASKSGTVGTYNYVCTP